MTCILVVDDEPGMGRLIEFALSDRPVRVVQVERVEQALEAIRTLDPRVVLLDLGLEHEDGLSLLSRLREQGSIDHLPVLTFTVHDGREGEALALGATGVVRKPFRAGDLRNAVDRYLR